MEDISIFTDKAIIPLEEGLKQDLGESYLKWKKIEDIVMKKYPEGKKEWNYPGKKYGWSYRIKDKKRVILYFLPRKESFMVAFVFGQKAFDVIQPSEINNKIKTDLTNARKYAEGRGVRINVENDDILKVIEKLIDIKLAH